MVTVFFLLLLLIAAVQGHPVPDSWANEENVLALHSDFMTTAQLQKLQRHLRADNGRSLQGNNDQTISALFLNRNQIDRVVQTTWNGMIATTTSTDATVAMLIQQHVSEMKNLQSPIRQGDPLFVALFDNIEQTSLEVEYVTAGVMVNHTATTDCGALLVVDHANQVSRFIDTGVRQPNFGYQAPSECEDPSPLSMDNEDPPSTSTTGTSVPTSAPTTPAPTQQTETVAPAPAPTSPTTTSGPTSMNGETVAPTPAPTILPTTASGPTSMDGDDSPTAPPTTLPTQQETMESSPVSRFDNATSLWNFYVTILFLLVYLW